MTIATSTPLHTHGAVLGGEHVTFGAGASLAPLDAALARHPGVTPDVRALAASWGYPSADDYAATERDLAARDIAVTRYTWEAPERRPPRAPTRSKGSARL